MAEFKESGLKLNIPDYYNPIKADEKPYTGLSAVDFIAETPNEFLLIEVKNLDNDEIPKEFVVNEKKKFLLKTKQTKCRDCRFFDKCPKCDRVELYCEITSNFKDTVLNELAKGSGFNKPVICVFLLEHIGFDTKHRRLLYENINNIMPKFTEAEYRDIHSIKFYLWDKKEFTERYADIKIEV